MMLRPIVIVLISIVAGCASHSQNAPTKKREVDLQKLMGSRYDSLPNASGKFTLFVQKKELTNRNLVLKAVVIEGSSKKVLNSFSFSPGYCKWISEDGVEVFNAPGMIKKDEDISKFIRVIKIKATNQLP